MNNPSCEVREMIRHARIHAVLHSVAAVAREIVDYSGGADCPCSDEYVMDALRERLAILDELVSAPSTKAPEVPHE